VPAHRARVPHLYHKLHGLVDGIAELMDLIWNPVAQRLQRGKQARSAGRPATPKARPGPCTPGDHAHHLCWEGRWWACQRRRC
jgi:hypothetical protein